MPHRVNAAMEAVQLPFARSTGNRFRVETCRFKLAPSRYSVLPIRNRSHPCVRRVEF
jgi:hypothetical protein